MKKLTHILVALTLASSIFALAPAAVQAHAGHEHTESDTAQAAESTTNDIPQDSGYVDKNGNPISVDEYNRQREEASKNIVERQPLAAGAIGLLLAMGIAWGAFRLFGNKSGPKTPMPA